MAKETTRGNVDNVLARLYAGGVPSYIKEANEDYIVIAISHGKGEPSYTIAVTPEDVVDYYNAWSYDRHDTRTLAGITADKAFTDRIADECYNIFDALGVVEVYEPVGA